MHNRGFTRYEEPITGEIYSFTSPHADMFYTLFFGPLLPYLINKDTSSIRVKVGERIYIGSTDKPMFLIPIDSVHCDKFASHREEINFYPSGNVPAGMNPKTIIPFSFNKNVYPHFDYQINNGKLYKHENNKWIHVQM